jgi:predicted DNA-binding protein
MVRIPKDMADYLKVYAIQHDRRFSNVLREAIETYIELVKAGYMSDKEIQE